MVVDFTPTNEEGEIPRSEGQDSGQELVSIENAKGQEHIPVTEHANGSEGPVTLDEVNPVCLQESEKKGTIQQVQFQDQDQAESFMNAWWPMIFEQVTEVKKKRSELEEHKRQIDRARYDLEIREIKLLEDEPLIPIARQLEQMGTDISQFLPWVESIHEKAQAENIPTLSKAAYSLAQDLRMYRELGGLKRNIQLTIQQLEILNLTFQKQQPS